ncbi:MAG: hypothetical protein LUD84_11250, partial [Clostridiales bacterium]|nr:hypothetical protein [Clostridiales bacterium]
MKLDELQELVDFMKENGVAELEYTEKNNSVHLRLAPPPPPGSPRPKKAERSPVPWEEGENTPDQAPPPL